MIISSRLVQEISYENSEQTGAQQNYKSGSSEQLHHLLARMCFYTLRTLNSSVNCISAVHPKYHGSSSEN